MLHRVISKYGSATHLAIAAAVPAALAQFASLSAIASVMLWLSAIAAVWMFMEPSVHAGETVYDARCRVSYRMFRDPVAWILLVAVLLGFAGWLNSGVALQFDAEQNTWSISEPAFALLPASAGTFGLWNFAVFVSIAVVVLGIRHTLGKNARIWFGCVAGAVSATGAVAAVVCAGYGIEPFATASLAGFEAGLMPGALYALFLPLSVACGIDAEDNGISWARPLFAWSVAGNAAGAFTFLPGMLSVCYFAAVIPVAAVSLVFLKMRRGPYVAARASAMLAFGITLAFVSMVLPKYETVFDSKIEGIESKEFSGKQEEQDLTLRRIATSIWLDRPWCGTGAGAFGLNVPFFARQEDWDVLPPKPEAASNGCFTLLAEQGICGVLLALACFVPLLHFWIMRLAGSFAWHSSEEETQKWIVCMPAAMWSGPLVLCMFAADIAFSSNFPLSSLAVGTAATVALSAASIPAARRIPQFEQHGG